MEYNERFDPAENLEEDARISQQERTMVVELSDNIKQLCEGGVPEVSFDVLHMRHTTIGDIEAIRHHFEECDIYIPEGYDVTEKGIERLRALIRGEITPEELMQESNIQEDHFYYEQIKRHLEIIYNSHKVLTVIDVPAEQGYSREMANINRKKKIFDIPFDEYMINLRECNITLAELYKQREEYMIQKLPGALKEVIDSNPQLKSKLELKVFLWLGVIHTPVSNMMDRAELPMKRSFQEPQTIFPYESEAVRSERFGLPASEELLAHEAMELILQQEFNPFKLSISFSKQSLIFRKVIERFSIEEIKSLFEGYGKEANGQEYLNKRMSEKGVFWPQDEYQVEKLLSN